VTVLEKNGRPGGRLNAFTQAGHRFDTGPTLLVLPDVYKRSSPGWAHGWKTCWSFNESIRPIASSSMTDVVWPSRPTRIGCAS
jgi:hypothetical protein